MREPVYCNFFTRMIFFGWLGNVWAILFIALEPPRPSRDCWTDLSGLHCKNLYLCSAYIYVYRIMTFMKFGSLLNACCQIGSKSIGNIFNIYEYIWLVHKINDKSCGWQTALELLPVHTGPILNSVLTFTNNKQFELPGKGDVFKNIYFHLHSTVDTYRFHSLIQRTFTEWIDVEDARLPIWPCHIYMKTNIMEWSMKRKWKWGCRTIVVVVWGWDLCVYTCVC